MNFVFRAAILTVFLCIPFHESVSLAARIPAIPLHLRKTNYAATRVEGMMPDIKASLSDLDILQRYVCPIDDIDKRQEENLSSNLAIKHELENVLQMIQELERQLVDLINNFGEESPTVTVPENSSGNAIDEQQEDTETTALTLAHKSTITLENIATITSEALWYPSDGVVDISSTVALTSEVNATSTATAATESTSRIAYKFDARSSSNIAVYYGQSPRTSSSSLTAQCSDPNIDIVVLAFVVAAKSGGDYPAVNFGAACNFDQTPIMAEKAPGLLRCPELAEQIETCQELGKKILLSMGGATGQIVFTTDEDAIAFAKVMWGLFGPLGALDEGLRPFGRSVMDGFDIDNEDKHPESYTTFAKTFRSLFASAFDKSYYLSSAPQCPFPDESNPTDMLLLCDFVFVQFYNNPSCDIGSMGYESSLRQWASALERGVGTWFLGAPAWSQAGPTAYANIGGVEGMRKVVSDVADRGFSNFGGVMFWAGPEGQANTEGEKDIIAWAKDGLTN